jgi:dTDP-4-amino-4,6-dideoxygalactose transaminase
LGYAAAFSFHARKVISTGEGGMVTTDDGRLAETIRLLRNHGGLPAADPEVEMPSFGLLGFNYRMTDIQAAVGIVQLSKLDSFVMERSRWASVYSEELPGVTWLETPTVPKGYKHAWQSYVCFVNPGMAAKSRKGIMKDLARAGIQTRAGTHAIHMSDFYRRKFGCHDSDCPVSKELDRQTLALPMHNRLTESDLEFVIETLRKL